MIQCLRMRLLCNPVDPHSLLSPVGCILHWGLSAQRLPCCHWSLWFCCISKGLSDPAEPNDGCEHRLLRAQSDNATHWDDFSGKSLSLSLVITLRTTVVLAAHAEDLSPYTTDYFLCGADLRCKLILFHEDHFILWWMQSYFVNSQEKMLMIQTSSRMKLAR